MKPTRKPQAKSDDGLEREMARAANEAIQHAGEGPFRHISSPKKRAFLAAYSELGLVRRAALAADVSRTSHVIWMREDEEYAGAFKIARELAASALEDAAVQRAVYGIQEPVYHQGKIVGYVQRYSDTLLIFCLKGAMPEKYKDRHELSGPGSKPLMSVAMARKLLHEDD